MAQNVWKTLGETVDSIRSSKLYMMVVAMLYAWKIYEDRTTVFLLLGASEALFAHLKTWGEAFVSM